MMVAVLPLVLIAASAGPLRGPVAVLPAHAVDGQALPDHEAPDALRRQIEGVAGALLVEDAAVRAVLDGMARQGARCTDPGCFARVGLFAGAEAVLVPIVDGGRTTLWRIDVPAERLVEARTVGEGRSLDEVAAALIHGAPEPQPPAASETSPEPPAHVEQSREERPATVPAEDPDNEADELPAWVGLGVVGGSVGAAALLAALSAGAFGVRLFGGGAFDLEARAAASVMGDVVGGVALSVLLLGGGIGGVLLFWSVLDE